MRGCARLCWIALPTGRTFWKPARNPTDSAAAWKSKRREEKLPRQTPSYGNAGPWKAWKAKSRLSTLSTALGNHANPPRFPHVHSSDDYLYIRVQKQNPDLRPKLRGWAKLKCRSGPNIVAKRNSAVNSGARS